MKKIPQEIPILKDDKSKDWKKNELNIKKILNDKQNKR